MSLKDRAAKAREAQQFNTSGDTTSTKPKTAPKTKKSAATPNATQQTGRATATTNRPTAASNSETANARARRAAGVEASRKLSPAEHQALRRRQLAQLSIELPEQRKIELLEAAADNGRTLKDEVLHRLFGD